VPICESHDHALAPVGVKEQAGDMQEGDPGQASRVRSV
jgi:hypothetical protein